MTGTPRALIGLLLLAGCEKGPSAPAEPETPQYDAWRKAILPLPLGGSGVLSSPGRITILPPTQRAKNSLDFCEVFLNYQKLNRFRVGPMADGRFPAPASIDVTLHSGPNWIDLWDSSSNRSLREQVRTQEGTEIEIYPTDDGYALRQIKRE